MGGGKFCDGSTTTLPEKHACSDARHEWRFQKWDRRKARGTGQWNAFQKYSKGMWHCEHCEKSRDATMASFAILNFWSEVEMSQMTYTRTKLHEYSHMSSVY